MQEIRSWNPPVVTEMCDPNKSGARHHRSFKLGSKLKYLKALLTLLVVLFVIVICRSFCRICVIFVHVCRITFIGWSCIISIICFFRFNTDTDVVLPFTFIVRIIAQSTRRGLWLIKCSKTIRKIIVFLRKKYVGFLQKLYFSQ